ncbi:MAG: peptidase C69 [Nitrospiraceae bacterium]|nr:peptidase C69 [Nitrospiraceae bacterium]|tara:strand:+ start:3686 stop:5128 length:1443 start_codon:yes stop_codon:yes gene_type:complete
MRTIEEIVEAHFSVVAPKVDFCSLRFVSERDEYLSVRQNILQPVSTSHDVGVMITVIDRGGMGYAATSELTESGLRDAVECAKTWAQRSSGCGVMDYATITYPQAVGEYESPTKKPWDSVALSEKINLLQATCEQLKIGDRIVDWETSLWYTEANSLYLTTHGGRVRQQLRFVLPMMGVTVNQGVETERRTFGGHGYGRQGGLEVLDELKFSEAPAQLVAEALELLEAPNCPSGTMDLLLAPDQMILQIHESIGHPIELDRILGDERNYAGTSFVTPDMFGTYQYGSELLNVTFDPTKPEEFASYGFDDDGQPATKQDIIRNGVLLRPLGGVTSQVRAGMEGVANSRAAGWNRPPIDRMANLNLEPGSSSMEEMVASVERGILMKTNCSWSIDDSRNKFQFGCEWAQLIEDGRLTTVVKKPNYRGISATFWRNLKMVGHTGTVEVLGTPYCGKGEPNQSIRVGHSTPMCLFSQVDVFGGV